MLNDINIRWPRGEIHVLQQHKNRNKYKSIDKVKHKQLEVFKTKLRIEVKNKNHPRVKMT